MEAGAQTRSSLHTTFMTSDLFSAKRIIAFKVIHLSLCFQTWSSHIVVTCSNLTSLSKVFYHCMGVFLLDTGFQYSHACKKLGSLVIINFVKKKNVLMLYSHARPYKYIIHQANCWYYTNINLRTFTTGVIRQIP